MMDYNALVQRLMAMRGQPQGQQMFGQPQMQQQPMNQSMQLANQMAAEGRGPYGMGNQINWGQGNIWGRR